MKNLNSFVKKITNMQKKYNQLSLICDKKVFSSYEKLIQYLMKKYNYTSTFRWYWGRTEDCKKIIIYIGDSLQEEVLISVEEDIHIQLCKNCGREFYSTNKNSFCEYPSPQDARYSCSHYWQANNGVSTQIGFDRFYDKVYEIKQREATQGKTKKQEFEKFKNALIRWETNVAKGVYTITQFEMWLAHQMRKSENTKC